MDTDEIISSSVVDTLNQHVSIREFLPQSVPKELLQLILNAARRSPTSSNLQAYSIVVVKNDETKRELARLAGNQSHIETCDTFVAICADIKRLSKACEIHGKTLAKNLENSLVSTVDAALVGMSLSLAAESVGLGTVMIGGMRNHPKKVADLLGFPKGVYVVFGLCIGWPDWERVAKQKPRFREDVIIHQEKYQADYDEKLCSYDKELASHYQSEGRDTPDNAWTGIIANRFAQARRPELKSTLKELGFAFD